MSSEPFIIFRGLDSMVLSQLAEEYDNQGSTKKAEFCRSLMGLVVKHFHQSNREFCESVKTARKKIDRKIQ